MPERVTVDEAIRRAERGVQPPVIAIDGLPCSGKSTLAADLSKRINGECVYLDEFVLPEQAWRTPTEPAFPFNFIRYDEFLAAVTALAVTGRCAYYPFDWDVLEISSQCRTVRLTRPVIVEGVSSLNSAVCHLYGLRIFVESDRATVLAAAIDRGVGRWGNEWRDLFLPSADIYMATQPACRADLVVPGRGAARVIAGS